MKCPTFIIIGAHKAATTSLHYYLDQHPEIYLIPGKGTDILAWCNINSTEDIEKYLSQYEGASTETALGEASSIYLHTKGVAQKIKNLFPEIKLIAVLRNPAERAYSHAFYRKVFTKKELKNIDSIILNSDVFIKPGYYYAHLRPYFDLFTKEQIKILLFDDLVRQPDQFFKELFTFIEVDSTFKPLLQEKHHKGKLKVDGVIRRSFKSLRSQEEIKNYLKIILKPILPQLNQLVTLQTESSIPPLSDQLRGKLLAIYRDDITQLQELTCLDFSHWLQEKS